MGVEIEFDLKYPDGNVRSSQNYYEMLLKKMDLLETELEAARKETEFNRKSLRDLEKFFWRRDFWSRKPEMESRLWKS